MDFGIMFFASAAQTGSADPYKLIKDAVRFADQHGFCCVWTPERHFHDFGGLFPSPSVLSAGLALITDKIQIRAGSLISPLHDPIRIAEEWSLVDNLSAGRVAISFGSGWNVDDFVFFPDRYALRQQVMFEQIALVEELWQGKSIQRRNPAGKEVSIELFPKPIQPMLPIWITSSGNIDTFITAGRLGANLLTHFMGQDIVLLAEKIAAYRDARERYGHDSQSGIVSLMVHTYVGKNMDVVRADVRGPLRDYLRSAVALEKKSAEGGGVISGGKEINSEEISNDDMEQLLDLSFERYFKTAGLMGTPDFCRNQVRKFAAVGVNEIACLIDFGVDTRLVLEGLEHLSTLRDMCSTNAITEDVGHAVEEFSADF